MEKRGLIFAIILLGIFLISLNFVSATPQINLINITPNLDFTRFLPYNITANITNTSALTSVQVNVSGINGDGISCWDYFINGTCASETLNFDMTYDSEDIWKKQNIYPDYIYPEIFFASSEVTWNNEPSDISMWRRSYHLFNFTNHFTMVENMSFWVEFNAIANNLQNSNQLYVYIIGNGSSVIGLDYFTSDWRTKTNTELVTTFSRDDAFHHTHTANSSHRLVALVTNSDGTIGTKNINVSDTFWVILYQDSTNINRGWNLRYHDSSLCDNQNAWYVADRSGGGTWNTPIAQAGCPDAHIHVARNNAGYMDGVNATIIATDINSDANISSQDFYYGELPNSAPNPTSFTNPVTGGIYNETFVNITWNPATDPNFGDVLTYNISLLNSDESFNQTLNVTTTTSYYWNTTDISDGNYNLRLEVCDDATPSLCVNSTLGGNFTLDKTDPLYSLTSRSIISNSSFNSSLANTGDLIIVYFNSSGPLINPNVTFYSGGYTINNLVTIANTSNQYNATYIVNTSDIDGGVDFEIDADNLDQIYLDAEDSDVVVDKTAPTLSITSPTATTYTSTTQSLEISSTDSHPSIIWYNWNGTNITYTNSLNIVFSEVSNTIYVWANDSLGNFNSTNVSFTINTPSTTTPSSGGGTSYYFYEQNKYSNKDILELKIKMKKNTQKELNIDNSKETGISKISLTSKDYLSGEIKFLKLNSLPPGCNFPDNLQNKVIYKIIQINSTIDKKDLESVSLFIDIDNSWINQNKITKINGIKCLPIFENVESSLIQEEKDFSSYNFSSNGFSTWIIFGNKELEVENTENISKQKINETNGSTIENTPQNDSDKKDVKDESLFCLNLLSICWYWWLIPIFLLIIIVSFAIHHKKKAKHKKYKKN